MVDKEIRKQKVIGLVKLGIGATIAAIWIQWLWFPVIIFWLALANVQIREALKPPEKTGFEKLFDGIEEVLAQKTKP